MRQVSALVRHFNKSDFLAGISFKARVMHSTSDGDTDTFWKNKNLPAAETQAQGRFSMNGDRETEVFKQTCSAFVVFCVKACTDTGPR